MFSQKSLYSRLHIILVENLESHMFHQMCLYMSFLSLEPAKKQEELSKEQEVPSRRTRGAKQTNKNVLRKWPCYMKLCIPQFYWKLIEIDLFFNRSSPKICIRQGLTCVSPGQPCPPHTCHHGPCAMLRKNLYFCSLYFKGDFLTCGWSLMVWIASSLLAHSHTADTL